MMPRDDQFGGAQGSGTLLGAQNVHSGTDIGSYLDKVALIYIQSLVLMNE